MEFSAQPLNAESVAEPTRSTSAGRCHETSSCLTTLARCPPWIPEHGAKPLDAEGALCVHAFKNLAPKENQSEVELRMSPLLFQRMRHQKATSVVVLSRVLDCSVFCGATACNMYVPCTRHATYRTYFNWSKLGLSERDRNCRVHVFSLRASTRLSC